MQEIFILNDDSKEAFHAAEYAFNLAVSYNKNITLLNIPAIADRYDKEKLVHAEGPWDNEPAAAAPETAEHLEDYLKAFCRANRFAPEIKKIAAGAYTEANLISYINSQQACMVVMPAVIDENEFKGIHALNMQAVINRICCPVLIVPDECRLLNPERILYLADLRYAQIPILRYLLKFDGHDENVILAHRCAPGLPELTRSYAAKLFEEGICRNIKSDRLFFTQMTDRKIDAVVDTLINGLQADLLACANRHFHFDELIGPTITSKLPNFLNIPVLVFPN